MSYSHHITTMTTRRMDIGESTSNRDLRRIIVSIFFSPSINIFLQVDYYYQTTTSTTLMMCQNVSTTPWCVKTHLFPFPQWDNDKQGWGEQGEDQQWYGLKTQYLCLGPFGMFFFLFFFFFFFYILFLKINNYLTMHLTMHIGHHELMTTVPRSTKKAQETSTHFLGHR